MDVRYMVEKLRNQFWHWVGRSVPDRVAYWVFVAQGAKHCGGPDHPEEVVPDVPFMTVHGRVADSIAPRFR